MTIFDLCILIWTQRHCSAQDGHDERVIVVKPICKWETIVFRVMVCLWIPRVIVPCSWGICIINSQTLPSCASPICFGFFSLQLALCPIQHLVYAKLLYVWMHVYLRYCAAWWDLIKSRDGAMVHFHNSLQLKATGHCSLFLPCFYKETCLRILNVFTEQALVCVAGSFRDVKHQLTNIYDFEKYYLIKTNGNNVDTKTAVCENKHVS